MRYAVTLVTKDGAHKHLTKNSYSFYFQSVTTKLPGMFQLAKQREDGIYLYSYRYRYKSYSYRQYSGVDYYIYIPEQHPWFNIALIASEVDSMATREVIPDNLNKLIYVKLRDVTGREIMRKDK